MSTTIRRALVALVGLALAACVAASAPTAAPADTTYLVLAPQGQSTAKAASRVAAAGGTVVADYSRSVCSWCARPTRLRRRRRGRGRRSGRRHRRSGHAAGRRHARDRRVRTSPKATGEPDRRAALRPAVGHAADRRRAGARRHHRQPERRGRRARQRHLQHPSRPRHADRQGQKRVLPGRRRSTPARRRGTRPPPPTARTSPARSPPRSTASAWPASRRASRSPR